MIEVRLFDSDTGDQHTLASVRLSEVLSSFTKIPTRVPNEERQIDMPAHHLADHGWSSTVSTRAGFKFLAVQMTF